MIHPLVALLVWIPVSLCLFWHYPTRVAILITFIGGWGVLPSAAFAATPVTFPYWILGTCLPSVYFITKATVTGLSALMGVVFFDGRNFGRLRFTFWDAPMLIWCTVPVLSGLANHHSIAVSLGNSLYQTLAWGVPYFVGRYYFSDAASLCLAARGFVVAGLAYIPICLVEIATGPQVYALIYGFEPYRWIGAARYVGYRPIGFLEDGNQLGIWMASSALLAVWLWQRHLAQEVVRIPISWAAAILLTVTLLCQSGGSILLLMSMLLFLFLRRPNLMRDLVIIVVLSIATLVTLRLSNVVSLRHLVTKSAPVGILAQSLKGLGRGSLGWRLSQDERHIGLAMKRPLLGTGTWNWWKTSSSRPWSLWLLAFGMYGIVGVTALQSLQLLPLARAVWSRGGYHESDCAGAKLRRVVVAVLLVSAVDNLLNGSMILPLLLLTGSLGHASRGADTPELTCDQLDIAPIPGSPFDTEWGRPASKDLYV